MMKHFLEAVSQIPLKNPGDKLSLEITPSGCKVAKLKTKGGKLKYSKTQYPNGTIMETKVTKV